MSQKRVEVEVESNVTAPWMPTTDALDGYREIDVVAHNAATYWLAQSVTEEQKANSLLFSGSFAFL